MVSVPFELSRLMSSIADELFDQDTFAATAIAVVDQARRALGASHAGVTVQSKRRGFRSLGADDERVTQVDMLQHQLREGPCVDAATEVATVWSPDLAADARWPRWGPHAAGLGLRSVLSAQLSSAGRRVGALNLYSTEPRSFDATDAALAQLFAVHAAAALTSAEKLENLRHALARRTMIGQAQGMLMHRFGIDADQAFGVLQRYSQHANVKLHEIAGEVAETGDLPSELDEHRRDGEVVELAHPDQESTG